MRIDLGRLSCMVSMALVGCAVGAPQYSGVTRLQVMTPESLTVVLEATPGLSALGSVRASCARPELAGARVPVRASFADFLCSRELLVRALREQAAGVGGTALTRLECTGTRTKLGCRARVLAAASSASAWLEVEPQQAASRAWQIELVFEPTAAAVVRWDSEQFARPEEQVELLHYVRANELVLGGLEARCTECGRQEVVRAIRQAAGRLGGRSLVGLECSRLQGLGERCRAELAALEVRAEAF